MPAKRPAAAAPPHEFNDEFGGLAERTEVNIKSPAVANTGEFSEVTISTGSSPQQSVVAKRTKRIKSGKERFSPLRRGVIKLEGVRPVLHPPSGHHFEAPSDDLFGEDEVDDALPGHIEALGAAFLSLESEGGATGATAFGTKHGRMPSTKISITRLYGWSSSGGFAEAVCLEAEPGRGRERIIGDLVGGPHGGIVHFCTTSAKVCKASWPGRRVYPYDIWRPTTISHVGSPAQRGVKSYGISSDVPPAAQASVLEDDEVVTGPVSGTGSGRTTELQQKLEDVKSKLNGLGTLPLIPGRRTRVLNDESTPRHEHRSLASLLPKIGSGAGGVTRSASQGPLTALPSCPVEAREERSSRRR